MPYILANSQRLYYEVEGKGSPLVLIAGYGCDLGFWATVRKELASNFQLTLFDNKGVGRSDCPKAPFTMEELAADALELIKQLKLNKPHILGHSMGGAIAQIIAHQHPKLVAKTIFAQPLIRITPTIRAAFAAQLHLYREGAAIQKVAEVMLPWLLSEASLENPSFCENLLKIQEETPYPPSLEGLTMQNRACLQFDSGPWYSQIRTAPLILSSDEDRICPCPGIKTMAATILNSTFYVFKNTGHIAPIERPQEFCQIVQNFINN